MKLALYVANLYQQKMKQNETSLYSLYCLSYKQIITLSTLVGKDIMIGIRYFNLIIHQNIIITTFHSNHNQQGTILHDTDLPHMQQ